MSSQILSIYDALVAKTFTVDGKSVTAKDINETPNAVETAGMPLRMLNFMDADITENAASESFGAGVGGNVAPINWTIIDRLFIQSLGRGIGARALAVLQAQYIADYEDMLRADTTINAYSVVSAAASYSANPINYPLGYPDSWYFGVTVRLTLQEKF
jgi:hypothetical protein